MTKAASITRLRFCLIWSALSMGLSIYGAATAPSDDWLAFNLACTLLNWLLCLSWMRNIVRELMRREMLRRQRVLALRCQAYHHVFKDRSQSESRRSMLTSYAWLGAVRALDELKSLRVALGIHRETA